MFTPEDRDRTRGRLLGWAETDDRITAAAITGSGAGGEEDAWSDIDLFFGVAGDPEAVLEAWTERLRRALDALHLFDLRSGAAVYRVFLLPSGLEVDLAFTPASEFAATGPRFRLVFGNPVTQPATRARTPPDVSHLIGLACHHVLHVRACVERGKVWQAEHILHTLRDHILALACARFDLESFFGRGLDRLPADVTGPLQGALPSTLHPEELRRALGVATECLLREIRQADPAFATRVAPALTR